MLTPFLRVRTAKSSGRDVASGSERNRTLDRDPLSAGWFEQAQPARVEEQARAGRQRLSLGVEFVTQNRMADGEEMDPELMASTGEGGEFQARAIRQTVQNFPVCLAGTTLLMADHLSGAVGPIGAKREVDMTLILLHPT